jgi:hypothetical protein
MNVQHRSARVVAIDRPLDLLILGQGDVTVAR